MSDREDSIGDPVEIAGDWAVIPLTCPHCGAVKRDMGKLPESLRSALPGDNIREVGND